MRMVLEAVLISVLHYIYRKDTAAVYWKGAALETHASLFGIRTIRFSPHRGHLEWRLESSMWDLGLNRRLDLAEINVARHRVQETSSLKLSAKRHGWRQRALLTGLEFHLPPPNSNQPKCPPPLVVHATTYGFCLNSSYGTASLKAMGSSAAWITSIGIRTASTLSALLASL